MITRQFFLLVFGAILLSRSASADPAALVAEGRAFLAVSNLVSADARFAAALTEDPNHQHANFLRAATRVLTLASQPAANNLLDRLGYLATGRDLYDWETRPAETAEGDLIVPPNVSAQEVVNYVRDVALPELIAAKRNLELIWDPNFILHLTAEETTSAEATIDHADVIMFRSLLSALELALYTLTSWNYEVQLTRIYDWLHNENETLEEFLASHPALLSPASAEHLSAARTAFVSGINDYLDASTLIRARAPDVDRFFMIDTDRLPDEEIFRTKLVDLRQSLNGPVQLRADEDYTVHAARFFERALAPREFTPEITMNSWVASTLPDATFGGVIEGLNPIELEATLADSWASSPLITAIRFVSGQEVEISANIAIVLWTDFHVDVSTDLINWRELSVDYIPPRDTRTGERITSVTLRDSQAAGNVQRFYRFVSYPEYFAVWLSPWIFDSPNATLTVNPGGFTVRGVRFSQFEEIPQRFLPPGPWTFTISVPGYATRTIEVGRDSSTYVFVSLTP